MIYKDQAATPFGALAWSFAQSRVSDPPSIIDAFTLIVGRVPLRKTGHTPLFLPYSVLIAELFAATEHALPIVLRGGCRKTADYTLEQVESQLQPITRLAKTKEGVS